MSVPICSVHSKPMKQGKGGGYFCPSKMPDGSWCTQRAAADAGSAPAPAPANGSAKQADPKLLLTLGALEFASKVYQGTGQADDALSLANAVFADWKDSL